MNQRLDSTGIIFEEIKASIKKIASDKTSGEEVRDLYEMMDYIMAVDDLLYFLTKKLFGNKNMYSTNAALFDSASDWNDFYCFRGASYVMTDMHNTLGAEIRNNIDSFKSTKKFSEWFLVWINDFKEQGLVKEENGEHHHDLIKMLKYQISETVKKGTALAIQDLKDDIII